MYSDRVELPLLLSGDAYPIYMDRVYFGELDGRQWRVVGYGRKYVWGEDVLGDPNGRCAKRLRPEWLRAHPDSLARIKADARMSVEQYMLAHPRIKTADDVRMDLVRRCERVLGRSDRSA